MNKISLIGLDLAKEGLEFKFVGPQVGCSKCRIKGVCFNLEQGKTYRITKVRDKENPCFVFNHDKVATVELEEVKEYLNIPSGKRLHEGSSITAKSMECDHYTCPNLETCNLVFDREGRKAVIKKIEGKVDCPKGYDLKRVQIS